MVFSRNKRYKRKSWVTIEKERFKSKLTKTYNKYSVIELEKTLEVVKEIEEFSWEDLAKKEHPFRKAYESLIQKEEEILDLSEKLIKGSDFPKLDLSRFLQGAQQVNQRNYSPLPKPASAEDIRSSLKVSIEKWESVPWPFKQKKVKETIQLAKRTLTELETAINKWDKNFDTLKEVKEIKKSKKEDLKVIKDLVTDYLGKTPEDPLFGYAYDRGWGLIRIGQNSERRGCRDLKIRAIPEWYKREFFPKYDPKYPHSYDIKEGIYSLGGTNTRYHLDGREESLVIQINVDYKDLEFLFKGFPLNYFDVEIILGERPEVLPEAYSDHFKPYKEVLNKVLTRKKRKDRDQALRVRAKITEDERRNQAEAVKQSIKNQFTVFKGCPYCEEKLTQKDAHADHIYPVTRGGQSTERNMIFVCQSCNLKKGDKTLNAFIRAAKLDRDFIEGNLDKLDKDY